MTLDEILSAWATDAVIDTSEAGLASARIPELHQKYLKILSAERTQYRKLATRLDELIVIKTEYYTGSLDEETLREKGWAPFRLRLLKSDVDKYLKGDSDYIELTLKKALQEEKVDVLESILKTIGQRTFHIKNFIEFERFKNGQ